MQKRFNPLKPEAEAKKPKPEPLKKGTIPNPTPVGPAPHLTENVEKDGLELRFPQRPSPAVLELFRGTKDLPPDQRWHFHFKGKYWYAKRNDATRKFAQLLIAQPTVRLIEAPAVPIQADQEPVPTTNVIPVTFSRPPSWRSRLQWSPR